MTDGRQRVQPAGVWATVVWVAKVRALGTERENVLLRAHGCLPWGRAAVCVGRGARGVGALADRVPEIASGPGEAGEPACQVPGGPGTGTGLTSAPEHV
ncbi:hypothetical protein GCM10010360_35580 [Streptomyces nogalater]